MSGPLINLSLSLISPARRNNPYSLSRPFADLSGGTTIPTTNEKQRNRETNTQQTQP